MPKLIELVSSRISLCPGLPGFKILSACHLSMAVSLQHARFILGPALTWPKLSLGLATKHRARIPIRKAISGPAQEALPWAVSEARVFGFRVIPTY